MQPEPASTLPEGAAVLVLQYAMPLGYCVHNTPLYEAIKTQRPDLSVAVATHGTGYATLQHNPFVDHLLATPSPFTSIQRCTQSLRSQLEERGIHPAAILTDAANPRSRVAAVALAATSALRVGYSIAPELFHRPLRYDWSASRLANNLRVLEPIGLDATHYEPAVYFDRQELDAAESMMRRHHPDGAPLAIFVTQNSGGQLTGWHLDRFVAVMQHVHSVCGLRLLLVGTARDQPAIDAINEAAGGIGASIAGQTSIPELAAALALSDLVVSLDTGTMHVGRAAGTPMVVLGPSWQKPLEWLPLEQKQVRVLRGDDLDHVPKGYQLDEITTSSVIAAVDELLHLFPPGAGQRAARVERLLSSVDHGRPAS